MSSNWKTIEDGIRAWVVAGSGLADDKVIWSKGKGPRPPATPYIALSTTVRTVGRPWVSRECPDYANNLAPEPTDLTAWTGAINGTVSANTAIAPDDTLSAGTLTSVVANSWARDDTSEAVSGENTFSVYVKRGVSNDVDGKIRIFDGVSSTDLDYVATDEWQRIEVTADIAVAAVATFSVWVDSDVDAVHVWGAQFEAGASATSYPVYGDYVANVRSVKKLTLQIQCFGGDASANDSSMAIVNNVTDYAMLPSQKALFRAAGWAPAVFDPVLDFSGVRGKSVFEPRAVMLCHGHIKGELAEAADYIDTVSVENLIDGSTFDLESGLGTLLLGCDMSGAATMSADLQTAIALSASMSGAGVMGAELQSDPIPLAADMIGAGTMSADLQVGTMRLSADMSGDASMTVDLQVAATGYSLPLSAADVASITGMNTPTHGWDCGVASGADDLVGSDDLIDINSPTKEVTDAVLGGDTTGTATVTTQGLEAATAATADIGAVSLSGLVIFRFNGAATGSVRGLIQKRDSAAGNNGWEVFCQSRNIVLVFDTSGGVSVRTIAVDHGTANGQVVAFNRSIVSNVGAVWSREGSSTGTRTTQSLTSTRKLHLGGGGLRGSGVGANFAQLFLWEDDGDITDTERLAVAEALGYE